MSGRGDGSQNNRNGRQVNPQRSPSGDQEPANELVNRRAFQPFGGLRGFMFDLYFLVNDMFWMLDELRDVLVGQYGGNDNNANIQNINVRDNNANTDNNEQHEDHNAVVGVENEDSDEAFEDCMDVHQYIPEEDPQPGVSRRRSREMDEEDVEPYKRIRWSEEFFSACDADSEGCPHVGNIADEDINQRVAEEEPQPGGSTKRSRDEDVGEEERDRKKSRLANSDSGTSSTVYDHSESSGDELFEDAREELDNRETGGSRKRSREDFEEEEFK